MGISGGKSSRDARSEDAPQPAPSSLKLVYFGVPGRAEMVRLALQVLGVQFEDVRITQEQWGAELKQKYGKVPILEWQSQGETHVLTQSHALLLYAAALGRGSLTPSNPQELLRAHSALFSLEDGLGKPLMQAFGAGDAEAVQAAKKALVGEDGAWTRYLKAIDAQLGESGQFLAGGMNPTFADIAYFSQLEVFRCADAIPMFAGIPNDFLDQYENIKAHRERIARLPRVADYYKEAQPPFSAYKSLGGELAVPGECKISNAPPTNLVLYYFGAPGRGEALRLTFALRGIKYEDKKLDYAQWGAMKAELGQDAFLPLLKLDGPDSAPSRTVNQSAALALYAARIPGEKGAPDLLPHSAEKQARIVELMRDLDDCLFNVLGPLFRLQSDEEKKAYIVKVTAADGALTTGFQKLDKRAATKSGYVVGDKLSLGDIFLFTSVFGTIGAGAFGFPKEFVQQFSNLMRFHKIVSALPKVKELYKDAEGLWAAFKPAEAPAVAERSIEPEAAAAPAAEEPAAKEEEPKEEEPKEEEPKE
eukprot:Hpha_TRINITY_DN16085_c1_g7::TRINITY_DN16085_c1_g7_i1::g.118890::m.118890